MIFGCINNHTIIDFAIKFGLKIYEFLLNLLYILDSDIRRDIFIGVTGLMVAIIIFIADIVSNKEYELEKRIILSKTDIISNMSFCIFIFLILLISSIVKCSYDLPTKCECHLQIECFYIYNDAIFFLLQLLINISILIFMYRTFNVFRVSVKLNTNGEYFNKELTNYINKRSLEVEKLANKQSLKKIKQFKHEFDNYIKKRKNLSSDVLDFELIKKLYMPIYANKDGIIKNYNYDKIDSAIDSINNFFNGEIKEFISEHAPIFIFARKIGDKVENATIIGYCLRGYKKYFEDFSNCIIYDENSIYIDDEIKLISKNLLEFANDFSEPDNFDGNNMLLNYLIYLYHNDLKGVRKIVLYQLEEVARIVCNDNYKNNKYASFLSNISSLAYSNNKYNEYKEISRLIYSLYYHQLNINNNDLKKVAYNFVNAYFKYDYFSIKKNSDVRFYDELMSNLLKFICLLIKNKKFDELSIVFENLLLDFNMNVIDDLSEKDILNFQFSIGIIQCLMLLIDKNEISDKDKMHIVRILNWTKRNFINIYDAWQVVDCFKKYYNKSSSIQAVYNHLQSDFTDHKYVNHWSWQHTSEELILRELLCAFNIKWTSKDIENYDEITKDDEYYFKSLKDVISSSKETKFERELKLDIKNNNLINLLKLVIADAEKKEKDYLKSNQLNEENLKKFERIIRKNVFESDKLEDYLKKLNKIENVDVKLKRVSGINELIPRDIFFEKKNGYENLAKSYGKIFQLPKEKEFINKIDSISKLSQDDINEVINKINNIDDYVVITSFVNCKKINNYDGRYDFALINNKKLEIMKFPQIKNMYLIEKKDLPLLQYCDFDEEFSFENVNQGLYYSLMDCSKDEKLRKEIIENTNWLGEKGDIYEQHEYLKQRCILKLFLAFRFYKVKNSSAIKFNVKE